MKGYFKHGESKKDSHHAPQARAPKRSALAATHPLRASAVSSSDHMRCRTTRDHGDLPSPLPPFLRVSKVLGFNFGNFGDFGNCFSSVFLRVLWLKLLLFQFGFFGNSGDFGNFFSVPPAISAPAPQSDTPASYVPSTQSSRIPSHRAYVS